MKKNLRGNLNIPLGDHIKVVQREAGRIGVSKTELGRLLIVHGTELLTAGRLVFSPSALKEQAATD